MFRLQQTSELGDAAELVGVSDQTPHRHLIVPFGHLPVPAVVVMDRVIAMCSVITMTARMAVLSMVAVVVSMCPMVSVVPVSPQLVEIPAAAAERGQGPPAGGRQCGCNDRWSPINGRVTGSPALTCGQQTGQSR